MLIQKSEHLLHSIYLQLNLNLLRLLDYQNRYQYLNLNSIECLYLCFQYLHSLVMLEPKQLSKYLMMLYKKVIDLLSQLQMNYQSHQKK